MSAEGLLEVAFVAWGNVATMLAMLITVLSGYLVVAFVAGKKMTRPQVILVNLIYVFISGFLIWGTVLMAERASTMETAGYALASGEVAQLTSRGDAGALLIGAFTLAVVGSLKFMWDVRHPKSE